MRRYLSTLHTRSHQHKRRFAFLVSGGVTLFIFAIWSAATFGQHGTLAQKEIDRKLEVSPLESLRSNLSTSLDGFKETIGSLKDSVKSMEEIEQDYTEMRENSLNIYGQ